MTTKALKVETKDIPYIWHDVKPLIDKALIHSEGELLSEDVLKLLLEKRDPSAVTPISSLLILSISFAILSSSDFLIT